MTDASEDNRVGYGKPPKHSQWKQGQSGNRRNKRQMPKPPPTMAEIIDRLLARPVQVTINGTPSRISTLEAIGQNLIQKWLSGHGKALSVLLDYKKYFQGGQPSKQAKVIFLDPFDATRADMQERNDG
jgi:Family of unknown function (DUF5681)